MRAAFVGLLLGCGIVAPPQPPGVRPAAPSEVQVRNTPDGLEVSARPPVTDVDGAQLIGAPSLLVFVDQPACDGVPAAVMEGSTATLPPAKVASEIRVVAAVGRNQGRPSVAVTHQWSPPPAPPETPIVFVDAAGVVQISWLPPTATLVRLLRNGEQIAKHRADAAVATDTPGAGEWQYSIVAEGTEFVTGPSKAASARVP